MAKRPRTPPAQVGDNLDLDGIYDRLTPVVYGYFLRRVAGDRALAEDLAQQTFLSAIRSSPAQIDNEVAWILTIARRRFVDHLRRKGRHRQEVPASGYHWPPDWTDAECHMAVAITRVPDRQRLALTLHYVDGLSAAEVGKSMDRSTEAVESLLARGRRSLRQAYEEARRHAD